MPSTDITFCVSKTCKDKCDRHESKHNLPDGFYSFCDFSSDPSKECKWRKTYGQNY